jgi:SAM-dependent methyltransferase
MKVYDDEVSFEQHDAGAYGARIGDEYDDIYEGVFDTAGTVDCLAELAGGGPLLEFGVGTGRVALELLERGLDVDGIDGSEVMLDQLARKPRGNEITPYCGDFGRTTTGRQYAIVALLANTIYALPDQDAQVQCFANAARHLRPSGRFVVEAWVPNPPGPHEQLRVRGRRLAPGLAGLVIEDHDRVRQLLMTTQIVVRPDGRTTTFPVVHRYAWPSELDLMARCTGFELEHRWGNWQQGPFEQLSENHVSVWRLVGE